MKTLIKIKVKHSFKKLLFLVLLGTLGTNNISLYAQSNCSCASCGVKCGSTHTSSCAYYSVAKSSVKSSSNYKADMNTMIVGTIFESLFTSLLSSNTAANQKAIEAQKQAAALAAQKAAEEKRIQEALAQAKYHKMMESYKLLEGSQSLGFKNLNSTSLEFKTLDGETEKMAANARNQFDNLSNIKTSDSTTIKSGTPFFGDTMPIIDIQNLVNLENDPMVVDLRKADQFVKEQIKKDSLQIVTLLRNKEFNGGPIIQKPDCVKLANQLKMYENQRAQMQKVLNLSGSELNVWEEANQNALNNAVKDGVEYFTGMLFERFKKRGEAADRLQNIYNKNADKMAQAGVNLKEVQAKIDRLKLLSTRGQLSDLVNNMNDWTTFMKDGMSALLNNLSSSNNEIDAMMEDPQLQPFFETEKPELNALLDISKLAASNKVFGKWVMKKVPTIALIEIGIKQSYNALDWALSYKRIKEANKINGEALQKVKTIQDNINNTYTELNSCPQ